MSSLFSRLHNKLAPQPSVDAQMQLANQAALQGDHDAALAIWGPLAQDGHAAAQARVGLCFNGGLGVDLDPALAVRWFLLAADQGDVVGCRELAHACFRGAGIPEDPARAAKLYQQAADQGDPAAMDMLSWMLIEGDVIPSDLDRARALAEAAADQGNADSMTRLGLIYHNAIGVERDSERAAIWWQRAAALGNGDGQAMLGAALLLGMGVERDPFHGFVWLLRGRASGSDLAYPFLNRAAAALPLKEQGRARRLAAEPLAGGAP